MDTTLPDSLVNIRSCMRLCMRCLGGSVHKSPAPERPKKTDEIVGEMDEETLSRASFEKRYAELSKQSRNLLSFQNEKKGLEGFALVDGWRIRRGEVTLLPVRYPGISKQMQYCGRIGGDGEDSGSQAHWVLSELQSAHSTMMRLYQGASFLLHSLHPQDPQPSPESDAASRPTSSSSSHMKPGDGGKLDVEAARNVLTELLQEVVAVRRTLSAPSPSLFLQRLKMPLFTSSGHSGVWDPPLSNDLVIEFSVDPEQRLNVYVVILLLCQTKPPAVSAPSTLGNIVGHSFQHRGLWFQIRDVLRASCPLPALQLATDILRHLEDVLVSLVDMCIALSV